MSGRGPSRCHAGGGALLREVEPAYYQKVRRVMGGHADKENRAFAVFLQRTQEGIRKHVL